MVDSTSSTGAESAEQREAASEQDSSAAAGSARWDLRSHLRLWPVAAVGLALDLGTKHWAFTSLDPDPGKSLVVIPHLMSFQRSLNTGALFGLGKGWTFLFILASVLALGFVLFLFAHSARNRRSLHLALGLVLAGALGNLFDRAFCIADVITYQHPNGTNVIVRRFIAERPDGGYTVGTWPEGESPHPVPGEWNPQRRQQGVVRDFIRMEPSIPLGSRRIDIWPWVFNLADVWLVFGVGLLMLNFWWDRKAEKAAEMAAATSSG